MQNKYLIERVIFNEINLKNMIIYYYLYIKKNIKYFSKII
jgi:hypothetical protein